MHSDIHEAMQAAGFVQHDACFNWKNEHGVLIISPNGNDFKTWQVKTNAVHKKGFRSWQSALQFAKSAPRYMKVTQATITVPGKYNITATRTAPLFVEGSSTSGDFHVVLQKGGRSQYFVDSDADTKELNAIKRAVAKLTNNEFKRTRN